MININHRWRFTYSRHHIIVKTRLLLSLKQVRMEDCRPKPTPPTHPKSGAFRCSRALVDQRPSSGLGGGRLIVPQHPLKPLCGSTNLPSASTGWIGPPFTRSVNSARPLTKMLQTLIIMSTKTIKEKRLIGGDYLAL